ncbi:MAG: DUF1702 family protein [Planctomycetota bacterium]
MVRCRCKSLCVFAYRAIVSGAMGREDMVDSMVSPLFIAVTVGVATLVLIATGWWRLAFAVFRIGSGRLTVRKLGLLVSAPADVERVNTLLRSFAGGFNAMISRPSSKAWRSYCDSLPVLFEPFANEGAAMGFTLRRLFRYSAATFEDQIARAQPGFRYLYYVGLGFWSGMRNHDPQRLARIVDGLDPMYRYLCYDGYGFKHAFFDPGKSPQGLGRLAVLEGYSRNAAYQGVGRAVFFMFMDRPDRMVEYMEGLGVHGADAAAGLGLAAVFVNPDRLEVARKLAVELPDRWRDHFHLGMCFGLKARSINNSEQFERDLDRLESRVQEAVRASVRECDRIELQVRSEHGEEGYRRWRLLVTQWMAAHVEYPLGGLVSSASSSRPHQTASA